MNCRNCGNEIPNNAKFCSQCGTTVKKSKTWLIITLVSVFVCVGVGIGFIAKHLFVEKNIRFDENNIGEVYYAQIDPDHVSETDIGTLYADNELLIVANKKASYNDVEKIIKGYNGEIVGWIEQTGDFQIKFPDTYSISELEQISEKISKNKLISSSNPNYIVEYANDDFYGFEFGKEWEQDLQAFDYLGKSWGWEVIRTFDAWWYIDKIKANGAAINPIRLGLIDNGFDTNHEDLGFALKNIGVYTKSTESHGTHVAGTMAAKSNNKEGICGVYPYGDGRLYGVSWENAENIQENKVSCIAEKCLLAELILRNVKVINCSYGYEESNLIINYWNGKKFPQLANEYKSWCDQCAEVMGDFLNQLLNNGYDFVIVSSAGNSSNKTHKLEHKENGITESLSVNVKRVDSFYNNYYSAILNNDKYREVYNRIIIVGALDSRYDIAYYSNVSTRNDIYAPGGDGKDKKFKNQIFSTDVNGSYGLKVGTSMAAPHVSGVAALVWTVNNDLTGAEVKNIICDDSNRSKVVTSCKMVDAYNCVVAASNAKKNTKLYDKKNGGVLNFVVDKEDESIRIEGAKVTALKENEVISTAQTDQYGHFELILPAGTYDIIIEKEPYETFTWNNITVKAGEVNYLSDWTKLELEKIVVELNSIDNYSQWRELYEQQVKALIEKSPYNSNSSQCEFMLYDLNSDECPELIFIEPGGYCYGYRLYTISNNQVISLDNWSGVIEYNKNENTIILSYNSDGSGNRTDIGYKIDGETLNEQFKLFYDDFDFETRSVKYTYQYNGEDISEQRYHELLEELIPSDVIHVSETYDIKHYTADMIGTTLAFHPEKKVKGRVATKEDDLNVRSEPNDRSDIIGKLPKDSEIEIVACPFYWYQIDYNGQMGFVSKDYISLITDIEVDNKELNTIEINPSIEVFTAVPWANGLTYILHMEGDFSSYSYVLYTNESSNELIYASSGSSDHTTIELCSASTISKVKVIITPYNKHNKPGQTIQIEADDSKPISTSPINSVDKKGTINVHGGVVAGYNKTYVVYNGKPNEKIRENLGNGWYITAIAEYEKDGITWYDLYDTDDHDYYGWVDSKYIDFN